MRWTGWIALSALWVPGGVLAWFALGLADRDHAEGRAALRAELERAARETANSVGGEVRRLWDEARGVPVDSAPRDSAARTDPAARIDLHLDVPVVWIDATGRPTGPPDRQAVGGGGTPAGPQAFESPADSPGNRFDPDVALCARALAGGAELEAIGRPDLALDAYAFYLPRLTRADLRQRLRLHAGRAALAAGNDAVGVGVLTGLAAEPAAAWDAGLPVPALAAVALLTHSDSSGVAHGVNSGDNSGVNSGAHQRAEQTAAAARFLVEQAERERERLAPAQLRALLAYAHRGMRDASDLDRSDVDSSTADSHIHGARDPGAITGDVFAPHDPDVSDTDVPGTDVPDTDLFEAHAPAASSVAARAAALLDWVVNCEALADDIRALPGGGLTAPIQAVGDHLLVVFAEPPPLSGQPRRVIARPLAPLRAAAARHAGTLHVELRSVPPLSSGLSSASSLALSPAASPALSPVPSKVPSTVPSTVALDLAAETTAAAPVLAVEGAAPAAWVVVTDPRWGERYAALDRRRRLLYASVACALAITGGAGLALVVLLARQRRLAELKERLLMSVSHELRTPLTAVRMLGELLGEDGPVDPPRTRRLGRLLHLECVRLGQMLENLLDSATLRRGGTVLSRGPVALDRLASDVAAGFAERARAEGVELRWTPPQTPADGSPLADSGAWRIATHGPSVERILLNLLDNALKYRALKYRALKYRAPTGARPTGSWIELQLARRGAEVTLSVADNGPGIPRAERVRVFEEFTRLPAAARVRGSGLGLYLCRELAIRLGGRLELESEEGRGSRFTLVLPGATPGDPDIPQAEPATPLKPLDPEAP